jgi:CRP-like cAMP-binding protein
VSKRLKVERIPPGELVIKAGEEGDSMYFINSGSVSVLVDGVEIDRKGIGGFFGEAALVLKQARIADVRSCGAKVYKDHGLPEAAELFRLHRDDFHAVCEMYPELKSRLSTIAEQNVHRVEKARGSVSFPYTNYSDRLGARRSGFFCCFEILVARSLFHTLNFTRPRRRPWPL